MGTPLDGVVAVAVALAVVAIVIVAVVVAVAVVPPTTEARGLMDQQRCLCRRRAW